MKSSPVIGTRRGRFDASVQRPGLAHHKVRYRVLRRRKKLGGHRPWITGICYYPTKEKAVHGAREWAEGYYIKIERISSGKVPN